MTLQRTTLKAGMTVLDAAAQPIGQVQAVQDDRLVVQLQQAVTLPVDTLQEITAESVRLHPETLGLLPTPLEEVRAVAQEGQVCAACGAREGADTVGRYVRHGDAWFCPDCWRGLPGATVTQVVHEVALRGVPIS